MPLQKRSKEQNSSIAIIRIRTDSCSRSTPFVQVQKIAISTASFCVWPAFSRQQRVDLHNLSSQFYIGLFSSEAICNLRCFSSLVSVQIWQGEICQKQSLCRKYDLLLFTCFVKNETKSQFSSTDKQTERKRKRLCGLCFESIFAILNPRELKQRQTEVLELNWPVHKRLQSFWCIKCQSGVEEISWRQLQRRTWNIILKEFWISKDPFRRS